MFPRRCPFGASEPSPEASEPLDATHHGEGLPLAPLPGHDPMGPSAPSSLPAHAHGAGRAPLTSLCCGSESCVDFWTCLDSQSPARNSWFLKLFRPGTAQEQSRNSPGTPAQGSRQLIRRICSWLINSNNPFVCCRDQHPDRCPAGLANGG